MISHRHRLYLILLAVVVDLAALAALHYGVAAELVEGIRPELEASLAALLLVLLPAGADAALVERARRDPTRSGLTDDVVDPVELTRTQQRAQRERGRDDDDTPSARPPRPPLVGLQALGLVVLASALSVASSGCGMSPIRQHSMAVVALASAHTVAHAVADGARTETLDAIEREHADPVERTAARRAEHERWQPVGHTLDSAREAILVYLESVAAAHASDAGEEDLLALILPVARRAVLLYDRAAALLRALGVDAPPVPALVLGLIGGAQ